MHASQHALLMGLGLVVVVGGLACSETEVVKTKTYPTDPNCVVVEEGAGPPGPEEPISFLVASGFDEPWGVAVLPDEAPNDGFQPDVLITERGGTVRLVRGGLPQPPLVNANIADTKEGGVLGITLDPAFETNRLFYFYVTDGSTGANRVEKWRLEDGGDEASFVGIVIEDIPASDFNNGGQLRFGPDGNLYIATGDAEQPPLAQDQGSLAGKILRVTADGAIPADNPFEESPVYITGLRDPQAFDFLPLGTGEIKIVVADRGPRGDLDREGYDEVNVATAGDNLGWPTVFGCQYEEGNLKAPALTYKGGAPGGGGSFYTGTAITEWQGSFIMGTLDSKALTRMIFNAEGQVELYEVYLPGDPSGGIGFGRLRAVVMGPSDASPDGMGAGLDLYVATSNCDGQNGVCGEDKDYLIRLTDLAPPPMP